MESERKVVLVTGGGAGIGRAVCKRLAADGMAVGVADLNLTSAQAVVDEIKADGGEAIAIGGNVAKPDEVNAMFDALLEKYGYVSCLAANAGVFVYEQPMDITPESWRFTMSVNLDGLFLCCQRAANEMMKRGKGGAIMLGLSFGSFTEAVTGMSYCTSKWAGRGLTRSLALRLGEHDITVNGIGPGIVHTDMHEYIDQSMADEMGITKEEVYDILANSNPLQSWQTPEEMAAIYSFIFSDEARNITGSIIMDNSGAAML